MSLAELAKIAGYKTKNSCSQYIPLFPPLGEALRKHRTKGGYPKDGGMGEASHVEIKTAPDGAVLFTDWFSLCLGAFVRGIYKALKAGISVLFGLNPHWRFWP